MATWRGSPVGTLIFCVWIGLPPPWVIILVLLHIVCVIVMRVSLPIADAFAEGRATLIRRRTELSARASDDGEDTESGK